MILQKVHLDESEIDFIEAAYVLLGYESPSAYLWAAIQEKIGTDRRKLRALRRRQAMAAHGGNLNDAFDSLEAECFADR